MKQLTILLTGMQILCAQANEISESQQHYIERYKSQKSIPAPADMLLNTDPEPGMTEGYTPLFNGKDLDGWIVRGGSCTFDVRDGAIVGTCVQGSPNTYLCTKREDFSDFIFSAEIKWEVDGNSGIMLRAQAQPGEKFENIIGPQAEMEGFGGNYADRGWSGGIYGQGYSGWEYPLWLEAHTEARSALKKDEWNRITIKAEGYAVKTWVNGVPAAHWSSDRFSKGFFGLQVHSGHEGTVLFRNIKVKELNVLPPVWTDADTAAREVPNFDLMGEFISPDKQSAVQSALLADGRFLVARYTGGLPGDGWDGSAIDSRVMDAVELKALIDDYNNAERTSPTMGLEAPAGAFLTFPDDFTNIHDGLMLAGGQTRKELDSFRMHVEFMIPLKPSKPPANSDRGNSGLYIFNNYELQIIDSFALDQDMANNAINTTTKNTQWCGAMYKMKTPDVSMIYPPLRWQTYDIDFTAPVMEDGKKIKNARITVHHNGVLIHDDVELPTGTGLGANRPQKSRGRIFFQNHGSPVMYRNVWAAETR